MISFVDKLKAAEAELAAAQALVENKSQACREILRLVAEGIACGDETTGDPLGDVFVVSQHREPKGEERELVEKFLEPLMSARAGQVALIFVRQSSTEYMTSDPNGPTMACEGTFLALATLSGESPLVPMEGRMRVPAIKWVHAKHPYELGGYQTPLVVEEGGDLVLWGKGLSAIETIFPDSRHIYAVAFSSLLYPSGKFSSSFEIGVPTFSMTLKVYEVAELREKLTGKPYELEYGPTIISMLDLLDPDGSLARAASETAAAL